MKILNIENLNQVARIDVETLKNEVFMSTEDAAELCILDKEKIERAACSWGSADAIPVIYDNAYWLRAFTKFKVAKKRLAELPNFEDLRRIFYGIYKISDIGFSCKVDYFDVLNYEARLNRWKEITDTMKICYKSSSDSSMLYLYDKIKPIGKEDYKSLSALPEKIEPYIVNLQMRLFASYKVTNKKFSSYYKLQYSIAEEPILYLNCIDSKMPVKTDKMNYYGIIFRDILEAAFFTLEDIDVIRTSLNNNGCGDFKYYEQWKKENNLQ